MPVVPKHNHKELDPSNRVSVVVERAQELASELTGVVGELAELLKDYDKEPVSGTQ